uniref:Uncharacterized protein n=1 Tax=Lotus japonicus TaxID=34305 RepID=I3S338_LOTJA|nr:unknown [Lotus japonicus]
MLGSYGQPNNQPLFGWILVAKDVSSTSSALKKPLDYTLVWNSASVKVSQDSPGYVWLPKAPDGYKALGHVVTTTPDKPSLDKIKCVRQDLTEQCEAYSWIWGTGGDSDPNSFNFYAVRPSNRGTQALGVGVGAFVAQNGGTNSSLSITCLKNTNAISKSMPNLKQIGALLQTYSPILYLHPDEEFQPSSVDWFFSNGALLYQRGKESNPVKIAPNGTNLPQDPHTDGAYWLDLPADADNKERVKKEICKVLNLMYM